MWAACRAAAPIRQSPSRARPWRRAERRRRREQFARTSKLRRFLREATDRRSLARNSSWRAWGARDCAGVRQDKGLRRQGHAASLRERRAAVFRCRCESRSRWNPRGRRSPRTRGPAGRAKAQAPDEPAFPMEELQELQHRPWFKVSLNKLAEDFLQFYLILAGKLGCSVGGARSFHKPAVQKVYLPN